MPYDLNYYLDIPSAGTNVNGNAGEYDPSQAFRFYHNNRKMLDYPIIQKNSPAFITIIGTGEKATLVAVTNKFFLQGITENKQEKTQILETFGKSILLFFDERTKVYQFRGTFLDADSQESPVSNNWTAAFRKFYDEELRGTKLASEKRIATLTVQNHMYLGYPISLAIATDANSNLMTSFNMQWIITEEFVIPPVDEGLTTGSVKQFDEALKNMWNPAGVFGEELQTKLTELKTKMEASSQRQKDINQQITTLQDNNPGGLSTYSPQTKEDFDRLNEQLEAEGSVYRLLQAEHKFLLTGLKN